MRGLRRPSLLGGAGVRAGAQRNRNARLAASGLRLSAQRVMAHYYLLRDAHSEASAGTLRRQLRRETHSDARAPLTCARWCSVAVKAACRGTAAIKYTARDGGDAAAVRVRKGAHGARQSTLRCETPSDGTAAAHADLQYQNMRASRR